MISHEEIQKLAELARLQLSPEEVASLQKDISNILDYVGQLSASKEVSADHPLVTYREAGTSLLAPVVHNVMRKDTPRAQDDILADKREALLNALPKREGDYNVVRKIIQKDE